MASIVDIQPNQGNPLLQGIALGNQITQAQTADEQRKLLPVNTAITAQNALTNRASVATSRDRFINNPLYMYSKIYSSLPKDQKENLIATYPNLPRSMANLALQNINQQRQETSTPDILTPALQKAGLASFMPSAQPVQQQNMSQQQAMQSQAQNGQQSLMSSQDILQALQNASKNDPNAATAKNLAETEVNKSVTGGRIRDRNQAAEAVLKLEPQIAPLMEKLSSYSGVAGGLDKYKDNLLASFGQYSPKLLEYNEAKSQANSLISGAISQIEAYGKTDFGLRQAKSYFELAQEALGSNPQMATQYIRDGFRLLGQESDAVADAAQPIYKTSYGRTTQAPTQKNSNASPRTYQVKAPDGNIYSIPENDLQDAIKSGGKIVG